MDELKNDENIIDDQYLTFIINGDEYGLEISYVMGIIKMVPITKVPQTPDYIEGLINLRGELIGVIDVRKRFNMPTREYDDLTCIIYISYSDYILGMIVDDVLDTVTIAEEHICPPPSVKLSYANQFIRNIGQLADGKIKLLIDLERFLAQD